MIKIIKKFIYLFFVIKIYIFFFKKKYSDKNYEHNFQNKIFQDSDVIKKIFLNNKSYKKIPQTHESFAFHTFDWLNMGKKIGGADSVSRAKEKIILWNKNNHKKNSFVWKSELICKRLINLIYNYDFYAGTANEKNKDLIHKIILGHFLILNLEIKNKKIFSVTLEEYKAKLLLSIIYNAELLEIFNLLKKIILNHIDENGFHKSYNALRHANFINNLYEIRNMMLFFNIKIPDELNFQILNMSSILKSLFHLDGSLALFNGANNFYADTVSKISKKAEDIKIKDLSNNKKGIICYSDKNKKIFMDILKPLNESINNRFHAGTLSFELSCLNEKIITNCGAQNEQYSKNPEYLRYSAAHSTIILNNTNISELIKNHSYKRAPKNIFVNSFEDDESVFWESSHDGYLKKYHKIIKRNLKISKKNNAISGQDEIISTKINRNKDHYSIRFHLMPNCKCLLTNDKKTALIKTKLNQSWVFKANSNICVEDSIYVGNGKRIEHNQQIVIYGNIINTKKTENWSLIKS